METNHEVLPLGVQVHLDADLVKTGQSRRSIAVELERYRRHQERSLQLAVARAQRQFRQPEPTVVETATERALRRAAEAAR